MVESVRRTPLRIVALALVPFLALACGGDDDGDSTTDPSATSATDTTGGTDAVDEPNGGDGGGTLVAGISAEPDRFDPHLTSAYASFQVLENVYDTLVQPGDDLTMEPALATEWTISDDGLTWRFTLRDDVTFQNGRPFTADDVVYSLERIRDPDVGAGPSYRLAAVDTITAVDDTTVEITVTAPTPNLLTLLGGYKGMAIVPAEIVDDGSIDTAPVGTGPFEFVSFTPGDGVILRKSESYWRADEGLPKLDEVRFVPIPDATVLLNNLQTGEAQWIDSVPSAELEGLADSNDVVLGRVPGGDYHYFALNQSRAPFDDVRVRQAISMAIDREQITEGATFGAATPNYTAIPAGNFWYHEYVPFDDGDVDAARELLDAAGVDDLTIDFLVSSEFPETVTQAQIISAQLAPLGVTVSINDVDFSTWLAMQGDGEFDAFMLSWIGNIDPDEFYYAQHHSDGTFNFQGNGDADLDALLDEARTETDIDARKALYDEVAEIVVDSASYIFLYNPDNVDAWAPNVTGYTTRGDNAVRFLETSVD